ncbi:hypothetical protein [Parasitella parasitica]|uniref:Uncharacterized protein n=1 Tax=Parasitella parasitica TaxID=35722 RepID=A0A0B7N067_9FUNG|nr:hypothetical protein [Parasitella parasitica]
MYSPRRTATTDDYENVLRSPEKSSMVSSPLRAIASPFYDALKIAKSNASRDFDIFYGNLQQTLTPRTSQARVKKQTPDTTEEIKSTIQQKQLDDDGTRTSLTPLIERHTLREDARANYTEYMSRNPFYQESVSEIAETPTLSDQNDDTPMTYTSLGKRSSSYAHSSPSSRKKTYTGLSTTLQQKLAEERKRMDKLQSNLQKIRRQSSLLAEDLSATHLNFSHKEATDDDDEEECEEEELDIFMAAAPSSKEDILKSLSVRSADERRRSSFTFSSNRRSSTLNANSSRLCKPHSEHSRPPASLTTASSSSPRRLLNNNSNTNPTSCNTMSTSASPNRIIINEISSANLRSAETISTPGGSRVSNRFWKEIHGLNARRESASPSASNSGRVSKHNTLNVRRISVNNNKSWGNDDGFWSADISPVASSFNNKLFQLARENNKEQEKPTRIRHSFTRKLFDADAAEEGSLFHNPSFRKAAQSEQQAHNTNQPAQTPAPPPPPPPPPPKAITINNSLSAEIESANKRDEIKKRNNIPTMNASVLAELKAKHKEKLIDDTDSYKFA